MVTVLDEQTLAFSLGATDYLQKPIEWDYLKAVMDRFRPGSGTRADPRGGRRRGRARAASPPSWRARACRVRAAEHGGLALEAVAEEKPGLILLDLMKVLPLDITRYRFDS